MSKNDELEVFIDIDAAIDQWNEKNPKLRMLTRTDIFEEQGITKPTLQNWKKGKVPKALVNIISIMERTGVKFEELVTAERNGKTVI